MFEDSGGCRIFVVPLLKVAEGTTVNRQAPVPSTKAPSATGPKPPDFESTVRHPLIVRKCLKYIRHMFKAPEKCTPLA